MRGRLAIAGNLFLRGDSGLARAFARMIAVLRTLPEDELAALLAGLPEREANLLREAAGALRSHPDARTAARAAICAEAQGIDLAHALAQLGAHAIRRKHQVAAEARGFSATDRTVMHFTFGLWLKNFKLDVRRFALQTGRKQR